MDRVALRDLAVPAVIGVHDREREAEQTLLLSVEMAVGVAKAAARDDLADALDYSAVARAVTAVIREGKFRLIETAAERVAERLLADYPARWVRVEVAKPIAADGGTGQYTAVITVERSRGLRVCRVAAR